MFHLDIQYALKRNMSSSNLLFFPQTVSFPQHSPPQLMATSILPVAQVKNLEFTNPISNLSAAPTISSVFRTSPASTPNPATCPHFHCKYHGPDITQLTAALLLPQGPWATLGFSLSLRHGGPAPAHSEALHMLFLPRKVLLPRKYRCLHDPLSHLLQVFSRWPLSVSPPLAILLKPGIHLPFPYAPYFSLPALFLKITTWNSVFFFASLLAQLVKSPPANAGDARETGSTPGSGKSPREGNGNPLQYSCLENPTDRGAWRSTVHGVTKSQTQLSMHAHTVYLYWFSICRFAHCLLLQKVNSLWDVSCKNLCLFRLFAVPPEPRTPSCHSKHSITIHWIQENDEGMVFQGQGWNMQISLLNIIGVLRLLAFKLINFKF